MGIESLLGPAARIGLNGRTCIKLRLTLWIASLTLLAAGGLRTAEPRAPSLSPLAKPYVEAIRRINEEHARKPAKNREADVAKRLPREARRTLQGLLQAKDSPALFDALLACGEAALDLDLADDFEKVRGRLENGATDHARRLGIALSRPRFLLRGTGGLDAAYLERLAEILDAILAAYEEVFGFEEWSKVPGKKLRVRLQLDPKAERPPHFAPELPFHSEIVFPVPSGVGFKSPTADGKFLFYGLCHELGHVIAIWGSQKKEEDHHAWAHYTGVAIVEHLSEKAKDGPLLESLRDVRWRSLSAEKRRLDAKTPSLADRDGVLALFIALHDRVGPKAIGQAINLLDREDRRLRINRVRYYSFKELKTALLKILQSPESKKAAADLIPNP